MTICKMPNVTSIGAVCRLMKSLSVLLVLVLLFTATPFGRLACFTLVVVLHTDDSSNEFDWLKPHDQ